MSGSGDSPVSVVVPTFERATLVSRAVASVLGQSRPPDEIVVVDGGSTDDTAEQLRELYPQLTVIEQEDRGPGAARNRGVRAAQGEWVAFLDSDDEWAPTKLARQLEALSSSGRLVCHTREVVVRDGRQSPVDGGPVKPDGWAYVDCLQPRAISPSTVVVHRSVLDDDGLFDEDLPAGDDYGLWLRIGARYPIALVDEPLVRRHEGHADQLSRSLWNPDRFHVSALEQAWRTFDLAADDRIETLTLLLEKLRTVVGKARDRQREDIVDDLEHRIPHYERLLLLERVGLAYEW